MHPDRLLSLIARTLAGIVLALILVMFIGAGLFGDPPIYAHRFSAGEALMGVLLIGISVGLGIALVKPQLGGLITTFSALAFLATNLVLSASNTALFTRGQWFIYVILITALLLLAVKKPAERATAKVNTVAEANESQESRSA